MFWIGLIVGWLTAAPLVVLGLAMIHVASEADARLHAQKPSDE